MDDLTIYETEIIVVKWTKSPFFDRIEKGENNYGSNN